MSLAGRLRRAAADALGRRRPGVDLVRLEPPQPPALPRRPRALPAPQYPVCRRCGTRHEPRPHPAAGGTGLRAAYSRIVLPDPARLERLRPRDDGDTSSLVRDAFNPWWER